MYSYSRQLVLACLLCCAAFAQIGGVSKVGGVATVGGLAGTPVSHGQNVLDTDSFGGTATNSLPTYNANWAAAPSSDCFTLDISTGSNGVGGSAAGGCNTNLRNGQTWTNDQFAQITQVAVATAYDMVCVRVTNPSNHFDGYCFGAEAQADNHYRLVSFTNGGESVINNYSATTTAANDVLNLQIVGTTLTPSVNGTPLATQTDATYATGSPSFVLRDSTTNKKIFTTWSAGSAF